MGYKLKIIEEEELSKFLLNPYEKTVYFHGTLFQKYPKSHRIDDVFYFGNIGNGLYKFGCVVYEKNEIILEDGFVSNCELYEQAPFVDAIDFRNRIRLEMIDRLEELKAKRLKKIKAKRKYKELYNHYKKEYFHLHVFPLLGTSSLLIKSHSGTNTKIVEFLNMLGIDELINITLGDTTKVDEFLDRVIESNDFLGTDILHPEIAKEAQEYVAAGKFTERELMLIDYVQKTKEAMVDSFNVLTVNGKKLICKNEINQSGQVPLLEDEWLKISFEEIEKVTHCGKVIYEKGSKAAIV